MISFYLKYQDRPSIVSIRYRYRRKMIQYSTGMIVDPDDWDRSRQRIKGRRTNSTSRNGYLDRLERAMIEAHDELISAGKIDIKQLKELFLIKIGAQEPENDYLDAYMQRMIEGRERSGQYKPGSIEVYRTVQKKIQAFQEHTGMRYVFDDIDLNWFYEFLDYLAPYNFKQNYLNKIIGTLKTFLNDARDRGYHNNTKYQSRRFTVHREEVYNVYLNEDELIKLYKLDLSNMPGKARTRDLFLVAAFTGLRYSDIAQLHLHDLQGDTMQIQTVKNQKRLVIPLHPLVRKIVSSYANGMPRPVANQRMNRQLKDICKMAGIDDVHMLEGVARKKYELVSTHTARRSFATNAYKAGIPSISIMKITGHSTERSFMKYIKISQEENANLMLKNPFFKGLKAL